MSLITFINSDRVTLASNKLVYEAEEVNSLTEVLDQADLLQELFDAEKEKIESAVKAGHDAGFEQGQTEGYEAALEHIAVKLVVLAKEANAARDELESSAGNIAVKIVQKIAADLGSEKTIAALAKSAAKEFVQREQLVLRVHPDNLSYMRENVLKPDNQSARFVDVVSDSELTQDDCVLETEFGRVKADLQTQLKVLQGKMYGS